MTGLIFLTVWWDDIKVTFNITEKKSDISGKYKFVE